jgi:hypothetical protein
MDETFNKGSLPAADTAAAEPDGLTVYSLLLQWGDDELSNYAWAGRAKDRDEAVRLARIEAAVSNDMMDESDRKQAPELLAMPDHDFEEWCDSVATCADSILLEEEGVSLWAASDLLTAVKALLSAQTSEDLDEARTLAAAAVAKAECTPSAK